MNNGAKGKYPDFAIDILYHLRVVFNTMYPLKIQETKAGSIYCFNYKCYNVCLCNIYPEGIQIIFNRRWLSLYYDNIYDFAGHARPQWRFIVMLITDTVEKMEKSVNRYKLKQE